MSTEPGQPEGAPGPSGDTPPPVPGMPLPAEWPAFVIIPGDPPIRIPVARPASMEAPPAPSGPGPLIAFLQCLAIVPVIVLGPLAAIPLLRAVSSPDERWANLVGQVTTGGLALAACLVMLSLTGERARSLGWSGRRWFANLAIGIAALAASYIATALFIIGLIVIASILRVPGVEQALEQRSAAADAVKAVFPEMSIALLIPVMVFISIWEEFVFRGFLLTRLRIIFRRWWLALLIGSVLFGLGHVYQGFLAVGQIVVMSLVLGGLFVWRRNLVPGIAFHAVNNVIMFLLLRAYQ